MPLEVTDLLYNIVVIILLNMHYTIQFVQAIILYYNVVGDMWRINMEERLHLIRRQLRENIHFVRMSNARLTYRELYYRDQYK